MRQNSSVDKTFWWLYGGRQPGLQIVNLKTHFRPRFKQTAPILGASEEGWRYEYHVTKTRIKLSIYIAKEQPTFSFKDNNSKIMIQTDQQVYPAVLVYNFWSI